MDTDQAVNRTRHQMNVPGAFVLLLLLMSTIGCATVSDMADTVVQPKLPNYTYLGLKPGSEDTITPKNTPEHWSPHYPNMVHEKARDGRYYALRETGWGISGNPGPRFDRNFEHWIYLHAESNVIYDLNAGEYDRFDGYVCLSDIWFPVAGCGHSGTVQFTFQLDNDIVYRSGVLRGIDQDEPIPVSFEIPADAQALIINVSDGGDGIGCDHWMLGNARLRQR